MYSLQCCVIFCCTAKWIYVQLNLTLIIEFIRNYIFNNRICSVFSLYPSFSCLLSACFLFYKCLGFSSFFPFVSLLKHFSCLVTLFSNIPLPPSLELRFANGSELELAVFHCAFFLHLWSSPLPLPVMLPPPWPRAPSSQPNLILVFLGFLWACWHCPGPGYLVRPASSSSLGLQLRGGSTRTVTLLPFSLLSQVWGPSLVTHRGPGFVPTWRRVLSLPICHKEREWPLSPSRSQPQSSVPQLIYPNLQVSVLCFFFPSYWNIVDLQCCAGFKCTAKWFSYI